MHETYMISDLHFWHKNILEYEPVARPFSSLEEMHETIIERWNNAVKPKDIVFVLGDFCFNKSGLGIAARLHGEKRLILGNHDTCASVDYLKYFDKLYGVLFWNQCILSHMPVHPNQLGRRWHVNVHGHTHSRRVLDSNWADDCEACLSYYHNNENILEDKRFFNVSCEQNNLTPIHADVILERVKEIKQREK